MKRATIWIAGLAVMIGVAMALRLAVQARAIGAGYAAKQICSGVFVARLPERFIVDTDVLPRLATVGPLARLLDYELDTKNRQVVAQMLGQTVTAQHRPRYGCTLGEAGEAPLFPVADTTIKTSNDMGAAAVVADPLTLTPTSKDDAALERLWMPPSPRPSRAAEIPLRSSLCIAGKSSRSVTKALLPLRRPCRAGQ